MALTAALPWFGRPANWLLMLALLPSLPLLMARGLYWDDYAWFWVFHQEGAAAFFDYMLQAAHPGFAPPMASFFLLGGAHAGEAARGLALAFHLANAMLLAHILSRTFDNRALALLTAAIYLLAPFYTARATLAHSVYDPILTCYLASIPLSGGRRAWQRGLALLLLLAGLSLETLLVFELLRFAYLRRLSADWGQAARRCALFWILCAALALSRFTWLVPQGTYGHYNKPNWNPESLFGLLGKHLEFYFPKALKYSLEQSAGLYGWPLLTGLLAAAAALAAWGAGKLQAALPQRPPRRWLIIACAFGLLFLVVGSLPYTLVERVPKNNHFSSHFTYTAQAGGYLIWAALLLFAPGLRLRAGIVGAFLALLVLAKLQDAKWLLFDEVVQGDLLAQLHDSRAAAPAPRVLLLSLDRGSRQVMYRERCLSAQEFNVPLTALMMPEGPRSYVYDVDCGTLPTDGAAALCTTSGLDRAPCPGARRLARYELTPAFAGHREAALADLLAALWAPGRGRVGRLVVEDAEVPSEAPVAGCLGVPTAHAARLIGRPLSNTACADDNKLRN